MQQKSNNMKNILFKILIISVFLFSLFCIAKAKKKNMQNLTLNNISALANSEEEEEGDVMCVGMGNLDCNGKNYKYFVDIE